MDVPARFDYQLIRHLAGSRVPFSSGYVESLAKELSEMKVSEGKEELDVDVMEALGDAHAWGWIDHLDIGTWMGRL